MSYKDLSFDQLCTLLRARGQSTRFIKDPSEALRKLKQFDSYVEFLKGDLFRVDVNTLYEMARVFGLEPPWGIAEFVGTPRDELIKMFKRYYAGETNIPWLNTAGEIAQAYILTC